MTARTRRFLAVLIGVFALVVLILDGARPAAAIAALSAIGGADSSGAAAKTVAARPSSGSVPTSSAAPSAAPVPSWTPRPAVPSRPVAPAVPSVPRVVPADTKSVGSQGSRVVYLTFDDGPSRHTPAVLELLARAHAKATFFVVGSHAAANAAGLRAIQAGGHKIGNHTWSHPQLTRLSPNEIRSEIARTDAAVGFSATCVRPPYGATNGTVAATIAAVGKRSVLWSVDSLDWTQPGAEQIADTIVSQVRPGSIVLMHDGGGDRQQSVAALAIVLDSLAAQGYSFRSLPSC